jgi:hypothetical protein
VDPRAGFKINHGFIAHLYLGYTSSLPVTSALCRPQLKGCSEFDNFEVKFSLEGFQKLAREYNKQASA